MKEHTDLSIEVGELQNGGEDSLDLDDIKIRWNHSRFIYPFVFLKEYNNTFLELDKEHWKSEFIALSPALHTHLKNIISNNGKLTNETIGTSYCLSKEGTSLLGLPTPDKKYRLRSKRKITTHPYSKEMAELLNINGEEELDFSFVLKKIKLHLFETQIGFLEIGVYISNNQDEMRLDKWVNNNITFLSSIRDKSIYYQEEETENNVVGFYEFFQYLVEKLDIQYIWAATCYQSVLLEYPQYNEKKAEFEEVLGKELYRIRRVTKSISRSQLDELSIDSKNPETLELFSGMYVGASELGVGRIGICEAISSENVESSFLSNAISAELLIFDEAYFYLYLLVLHQRYALLYLCQLASNIPKTIEAYINEISKDKSVITIEQIQEKLAYFKLRCDFGQVSNDLPLSKYYELIRRNLRIKEQLQELDEEMKMLSSLALLKSQRESEEQKELERQENEKENKRQAKFQTFIAIITTIFVMISTTADGMTVLQNLQENNIPRPGTMWFYIYKIGIYMLWIVFPIFLVFFLWAIFKRKND
jgi:hypothetical protein